jgi:nitrogen fixation protein
VTVPTSTIVFGSYLKMFLQEDDYGVKVFGDWSATVADQGYDGSLLAEVETFEGDEVFVLGTVTEHDGMIEFVPRSAYHVAVLARNRPAPEAALRTIEEIAADPYRYAGALVRVDDASLADVDPDDPATGWPAYGTKSKDIRIRQATGPKVGLPIYEGTGIPGSFEPDPGFDVVGALSIEGTGLAIYPRKIEDVNPTDATLAGTVRVSVVGEDRHADVDLATLPASLQRIEAGGEPVPVVSLASVTVASGLLRHPNRLKYKPVAYDGRKPFETLPLVGLKSGVLYQGAPASEEEPDPLVSSYFWEGMDLSEIYFLRGVTDVLAFRTVAAPPEGDAEHGKGITLMIGGRKFAVNFDTLPHTTVDGQDAIAVGAFLVGEVIDLFTMDGSFTPDQIKRLHDYRLVSFDGETERTVRLDDLAGGYVLLTDPPTAVFPDLGADARVEDVYVLDMMRYIQVDDGIGEPTVVYLRDCATEAVEVEPDVTEEVVFYRTVLEAAGIDTSRDMYLFDFWLLASDNFTSIFPYTHDHLSAMYFRPDANRGYTTDPDLADYGGRVSTKAVYEIELHDVPQAAPSLPVVIDEETRWGTDANACEGCHYKNDAVQIPVDCAACHVVP